MKNWKKIISGVLATALLGACVACGAVQEGTIPDSAATRAEGVGEGEIYIDEESIALANEIVTGENLTKAVNTAFEMVNSERTGAGLAGLIWSEGLAECARVRAQELVAKFSHTRPNGSEWWTVNSKIQYGENLAKGFNSAEGVINGWKNSASHKANMMSAGFKTLGMGIHQNGNTLYWAQEFGY